MSQLIRAMLVVILVAGGSVACQSGTTQEDAPPPIYTAGPSPTPGQRWQHYEQRISEYLLAGAGEPGLCEWDLLGRDGEKVYVWALCQVRSSADGQAAMAPLVLHLGQPGIWKIDMPRDGSLYGEDIRAYFPLRLQACALDSNCFDGPAAMAHIALRRADPSIPPLIVAQGVELP